MLQITNVHVSLNHMPFLYEIIIKELTIQNTYMYVNIFAQV